MSNEQVALELTRMFINNEDIVFTEQQVLEIYFNYLSNLESKGE